MRDPLLRGCRLPDSEAPVDLAIAGGRITTVGRAAGPARETLDGAVGVATLAD